MKENQTTRTQRSSEWLRQAAEAEDQFPSISVGGLVTRLGLYPAGRDTDATVFGVFVKLIRRKEGLSIEEFAQKANIGLAELEQIERGKAVDGETVRRLAASLQLPADKLAQLAGISALTDPELVKATERFESKLRLPLPLTSAEESALNDIMQTMNN